MSVFIVMDVGTSAKNYNPGPTGLHCNGVALLGWAYVPPGQIFEGGGGVERKYLIKKSTH